MTHHFGVLLPRIAREYRVYIRQSTVTKDEYTPHGDAVKGGRVHPDRDRIRAAAAGVDGAVLARPASLAYLAGRADGLVVVEPAGRPGRARRSPRASTTARPCSATRSRARRSTAWPTSAPARPRRSRGRSRAGLVGRRVAVEADYLTARLFEVVAARATVVPLGQELEALRRIKDPGELDLIRAAVAVNDAARGRGAVLASFSVLLAFAMVSASMAVQHRSR